MSNTRDLTGLTEEQIEMVDGLIAELRDEPEVEYSEVGTLLIDLEGGEGSFDLDVDAYAWQRMGRIGQLDMLSDWISLLQELYDTTHEKHRSDYSVEVEYDERKRVHDSTIPESDVGKDDPS
jgi:hypothetical protein